MVRKRSFPVLLTVALASACAPSAVTRRDPCAEPANAIVAENCLPGDPTTEWDINGYGDPSIQGFGHDISVAQGETIDFKILTDSDDYRLDIYRMGYYGGMGARRVVTIEPSAALPQAQPDCLTEEVTVFDQAGTLVPAEAPLFDCGNWAVSASWQVPVDATSGIYFARLVREDPVDGERWRNDQFRPSQLPPAPEDDPLWEEYAAVMANPLREPRASDISSCGRASRKVAEPGGRSGIGAPVLRFWKWAVLSPRPRVSSSRGSCQALILSDPSAIVLTLMNSSRNFSPSWGPPRSPTTTRQGAFVLPIPKGSRFSYPRRGGSHGQ